MEKCSICNKYENLETHHIYNGNLRKKSEEYGATIKICRICHIKIHRNYKLRELLKKQYQKKIMQAENWTIEDFRQVFYKNYL